jgi:3-oxoacyl-[acyl-carrier protein] reductase
VPLGRIAVPADVVGPIVFLLSTASAYMTGQTLHVNGGTYMP